MQAIKQFSLERRIPYLVHFTRTANLPSILEHGLYPVARMNEIGAKFEFNDQYRLDGRMNSTSLSIAFPNCQMFYKLRMQDESANWVVLCIAPDVLWEKECAFCCHNAADARISNEPLEALTTEAAFRGMFEEIEGCGSREEQRLSVFDPTDVQAEVLVFDVIAPRYILGVVFDSSASRDAHVDLLIDGQETIVYAKDKGAFASRRYCRIYQ